MTHFVRVVCVIAAFAFPRLCARASIIGTYTLDNTDELSASGVSAGMTAGDMVINDQSENAGGADNTYRFTASGLEINRKHPSSYWFPPASTLAAPFELTLTAGAGYTVTVTSITVTASSSSGHITALNFGADNSAVGDYSDTVNFASGGATKTISLPSSFVISDGASNTFYIDANSNDLDSDHLISNVQINGTVLAPVVEIVLSDNVIATNIAVGTLVGTLSVINADPAGFSFSLDTTDDYASFDIPVATSNLLTDASLSAGSYTIAIIGTNGTESLTNDFTIYVDGTAPSPDPMTFVEDPGFVDANSVAMRASTATDVLSMPIEYIFTNTVTGDTSGWLSSTYWTNTSLSLGTEYSFKVKARDALSNETAWSDSVSTPFLPLSAGLTIVDSGSLFYNGAGTATISGVSVLGTPNVLLVGVAGKSGNSAVTASWGGTSLGSPIVNEGYSGIWAKIFVYSNLTAGVEDIEVTVPNATGGESFGVGVLSLSAPRADSLFIDAQGTNGPSSPLSVTFATATSAADLVFGVAGAQNDVSSPVSSHLATSLLSDDDGGYPDFAITVDYDENPSGETFTWTATTTRFCIGAVMVREVPYSATIFAFR